MIMLASNNYLGLSTRPEITAAVHAAIERYGTGLCGSRFLSGTYDYVVELENQLAEYEGCEEAMVFTSGYQANVGTISALMRSGDVVFIDRLSHASIVDGCRMADCDFRTFRHNDMNSLERLLKKYADRYRGKLIIVDGVFSMDGDLAPLPDIVALADRFGCRVMVDEAHATGIVGKTGRGTVEHFGLQNRVDIILGTFSKTFASTGGYIAGSRDVVTYVRHYGRSYMFSASPTPATIAGVLAALAIVRDEPDLRRMLWDNLNQFYRDLVEAGFTVFPDPPESAIITLPIGPDAIVRDMSRDLYDQGLFTSSVVYPAVSPNEGRLRLSLSAGHKAEDLREAVRILTNVGNKYGIIEGCKHEDTADSSSTHGPTGKHYSV
jgi:glycine C-acetyltransferase